MEVLTPKLSVRHLNKSFDGKQVLRDLSFDLMEGEFLSILGPSGCGKTTLLRILIGLEQADSGEIRKGGRDISRLPSFDRGMGIVFQNYALFPNMTVLQNVQYALTLRKETKKDARLMAIRTLEQVGLLDQMHKRPNQLSGGQQQRVAIARTLATNPDIILLDEPISALDVTNREIMKAELKQLQKKFNVTMLFITHDQEEAFFLSDRVMVMHDGDIQQLDTPLNVYRNPANAYVKEFVVEQLDKKYTDLLHYTGRTAYEK
ncbi:MAG: ATP-binding cassette domain-containing protein [Oscillospiraceae bacterium]|nr:ATP-binding cassette domain-containing protein [Oscillospiraceae bacterium]